MKKLFATITAIMILMSAAYVLAEGAQAGNQQEALIVQNSKGEYVGTITDALIDSAGNIGFVIVSIDETIGRGKKDIAVPTASFSTDNERKLILDVSKEKLAAAPEFKASDLSDPNFAETVYRFFGLMLPWTEGTSGEKM